MAQRGRGRGGREQPVSTAGVSTTATTEPILDIYSLKFDNDSAGKLEELYHQIKKKRMEAEEASVGERRELKDAVDIVGTCTGMCPDFEVLERFVQRSIDPLERGVDGLLDVRRMVKRYDRGGAGAGQVPLEDIRPPPVLRGTVDYLMDDLLPRIGMEKSHAYIRDRTRAIRKDFTRQRDFSLDAMYCHERIARFHILGLHTHCRSDPDQEQQETEQLKKVLQTLTEMYQDSRGRHRSPNEAEFRAYYMLVHQRDKTALLTIRRVPQDIYCAPILQWALKLRFSQSRNVDMDKRQSHLNSDVTQMNYALLFRLWEDHRTSYLMACILEGHLNDIRRSILRLLKRSIDPGSRKVPSETLIELLRLDTEGELVHWVNALGWSIDAEGVVVPQDQTDIPTVGGPRTPSQRLCVVKRPPSLTYSQLTLGITYDIGSPIPRQRRLRDEYGTPASINSEKPLASPVLPFPRLGQSFTAAPNSFTSIPTPGATSVSIASAPDATAPVFKWAPDVLQTLPSNKPVGSSTPSTETWKGFGAAAAALAAKRAASGVEAASSAVESVWSFPAKATAAPAFRATSPAAPIPVPVLGSIPASSNTLDVLTPPSAVKPPPFTWPTAPVRPQQTITDPIPSAASVPAPTPSLTSSFGWPSVPTEFAQSAPAIALTPTMTQLAPPVPVVDPTPKRPVPALAPPSSVVSVVSVPQSPRAAQGASATAGSSGAYSALTAPVPVPGTTSSVPVSPSVLTPVPVLGLVAVPIAPLPTLVPAPPIAPPVHPSPPAPTPTPPPPSLPQVPLYIRSEIIADQQYAVNLRYRSLRAWVLAYNLKLEREQAEVLRRQREEQQRLAAEDIAFNMSLGRYDGESDTAGLRHSLLGRKRKRWSHVDEDMPNPLVPHLMEEEKRRRIWQPGTFMRTIAQIARKRIRGHDIPQDWQVWISFTPDGGSATQWFRTKLVDTHQTSDLVKVKLGKRIDMTEQEEEPQPGLLILQCMSGMWRGTLDRAKELIEMVPGDNPFLPAFLIIMASDEGVPEWWVGELDGILHGLVVDRRAFILQSGSALATAESDFASEVDALTLDLEGIAPRLPLREVTNAFMNWWLVEFDYGAEQARSPTFDFPTLVWVVSVLMQALDKILEAVVGNCQEKESPIPFNDFPSLGDVDSVYRTILEYYTEIGGEEPHSPYTIVEENPEALLSLTHDTGLMVQFRLWQQQGRLRPRPGLRESELEKMAAAFDVELVQNLSGIDRSHLVFRNPPKAVLPPFQAEPTSRHATPPLLKRKHSALESDTSDLDMILNTRPALPATTNGHVPGGRSENGEAIKRSRLTLEDLKKPFSSANISFRVQMAKARFDLEILKASEITEDTTEKQLWTSKANALVRIAKAAFDNVLSSSSPDNQAIIDCRAIVEIMRTIQDDIFDNLRQRRAVRKNIQQLAKIQVLPGSVELRNLVEAATDLHDRLNS